MYLSRSFVRLNEGPGGEGGRGSASRRGGRSLAREGDDSPPPSSRPWLSSSQFLPGREERLADFQDGAREGPLADQITLFWWKTGGLHLPGFPSQQRWLWNPGRCSSPVFHQPRFRHIATRGSCGTTANRISARIRFGCAGWGFWELQSQPFWKTAGKGSEGRGG